MDEQNFEYFKRACPQRVMKTCRLCGDSGCIDSENLCTDWFNCQRRQIAKLNAALAEYQRRFPDSASGPAGTEPSVAETEGADMPPCDHSREESAPASGPADDRSRCTDCGKVLSDKAYQYFQDHPTYTPRCYDCNQKRRAAKVKKQPPDLTAGEFNRSE